MAKQTTEIQYSDNLTIGTTLLGGQITIEKFINHGGFGITYLAVDKKRGRVVLKECYPNAICHRRSNASVSVRSLNNASHFEKSVKVFVNEAVNLTKVEHANIVHVHQTFEENNTAYMVIDFVDGPDLQQMIEDYPEKLTPEFIISMLTKLLKAIKAVHEVGMLHRDISPDNILIAKDGEPVLIDFGAAREDIAKQSRVLSTLNVVKDGYSPQEFYISGSNQSNSSDLYSLAASFYHCISGEMPPNSPVRLAALAENKTNPYNPLEGRFDDYPPNFLAAIDKALKVLPQDRLHSAQQWLDALEPGAPPLNEVRKIYALLTPRNKLISAVGVVLIALLIGGTYAIVSKIETTKNTQIALADMTVKMEAEAAALAQAEAAVLAEAEAAAQAAVLAQAEAEAAALASAEADALALAEVENTQALIAEIDHNDVSESVDSEQDLVTEENSITNTVNILSEQIAFAHWDIEMPYKPKVRIVNNINLELIIRINSDVDTAVSGNWIKQGVAIYEVNGVPLYQGATVANMILNNMKVDPDGYARSVVNFKNPGKKQSETGLLAVHAIRSVGLANGIGVINKSKRGLWRTVVTTVTEGNVNGLREGDIILQELKTSNKLNSSDAFEKTIRALVSQKHNKAEFEIRRNRKLMKIEMDLAVES
jgi:serine/threonine protein kinase